MVDRVGSQTEPLRIIRSLTFQSFFKTNSFGSSPMKTFVKISVRPALFAFCCIGLFCSRASAEISTNENSVIYTYPLANSRLVSPATGIGIRYALQIDGASIAGCSFIASGSVSGVHPGKLVLAQDGRTLVFTSSIPFQNSETVSVSVSGVRSTAEGVNAMPYSMSFRIADAGVLVPVTRSMLNELALADREKWKPQTEEIPFVNKDDETIQSLPSDFPGIEVTKSNNPSPGYIYFSNFKLTDNTAGKYNFVLDNKANPIIYNSTNPAGGMDFKRQPNANLPYTLYTYYDYNVGMFDGVDSAFDPMNNYFASPQNSLGTDEHELRFLPDGGYVLFGIYGVVMNLTDSVSGGGPNDTVIAYVIQQFDSNQNLVWHWRTLDYIPVTDDIGQVVSAGLFDYIHCNALELSGDTAFILSSRHLSEITKIDRANGNMLWRWGGKHNQFQFLGDTLQFSYQHAIRYTPTGTFTLFDNGDYRDSGSVLYSRAMEYSLDETAKTATEVWQFRHSPSLYAYAMGYVQRLDDGNTLIGWGADETVAATEVTPQDSTILEIVMKNDNVNYRAQLDTNQILPMASAVNAVLSATGTLLEPCYPNPVSNTSLIRFSLYQASAVKLTLYDVLGREIQTLYDGMAQAGQSAVPLNASSLPNGAYECVLSTPSTSLSQSIIISK
jgi:Arylsulfotransferase (ASST)/Secretion system C-terminal sorting domain